jgi:hypothetical protein
MTTSSRCRCAREPESSPAPLNQPAPVTEKPDLSEPQTATALPGLPAPENQLKDLRMVAFDAYCVAVPEIIAAFDAWRKSPSPKGEVLETRLVNAYIQLRTVQEFVGMLHQFGVIPA